MSVNFKYADPSRPTCGEIRQKKELGMPLFAWEERILAMAGVREVLYQTEKCCAYCKVELSLEDATLDHKLPSSRGGSDDVSNLTIACYECNQLKRSHTVEELLAIGLKTLKKQADDSREQKKQYRMSNNKMTNFQIIYIKGLHLC